ncbi:serine hydrolase domain-containing protein, partial [Acinetobacter baumannii]
PSQVRPLLDDFVRRGGAPGLQYVAVDGRGLMHAEAVGLAAVAGSRPMRADTAQLAYSMSKTLTAAAVMKLAEQGLIGIDAPVTR